MVCADAMGSDPQGNGAGPLLRTTLKRGGYASSGAQGWREDKSQVNWEIMEGNLDGVEG